MESELQGYKIGFIGLGVMGRPMAGHLLRAGARLVLHNRSRAAVDALLEEWPERAEASAAHSPEEVAGRCAGEVIVLMLTNTPAVEAVVFGESGLLPAMKPGTLVLDMSTTGVAKTRECAAAVGDAGGAWVDAPVSGGQRGAEGACLTIMAGGEPEDVARAMPLLEVLGEKITHLGPAGAGQITKLANQVIVGITVAAVAEALTLAESAGVDPAAVRDAIRGGFAESRILAEHGERMVTGNFDPGGRATYQLKDVREALRLMEECGLDLPMLRRNVALWETMVETHGWGDLDHSGVIRVVRGEETL